jgi:hypothetical protein
MMCSLLWGGAVVLGGDVEESSTSRLVASPLHFAFTLLAKTPQNCSSYSTGACDTNLARSLLSYYQRSTVILYRFALQNSFRGTSLGATCISRLTRRDRYKASESATQLAQLLWADLKSCCYPPNCVRRSNAILISLYPAPSQFCIKHLREARASCC